MKFLSNVNFSEFWPRWRESWLILLFSWLALLPIEGITEDTVIESKDAFTVSLYVAERSAEVDPGKVLDGLKSVIARFRGGSEQGARTLLLHPLKYLLDYHYESPADPTQGAAMLVLNFEGDAITQHLRPKQESTVLTQGTNLLHWWAFENGDSRQLIGKPKTVWSTASSTIFAELLMAASTRHNVPLQLPNMDPRDTRLIQTRDVFGFLLEPIQKVSQRYPNDGLVVGAVKQTTDGQLQGNWMLVVGTGSYWFESNQPSLEKLLDQAMLMVSQQLSQLPQTLNPGQQAQWLEISVINVEDYSAQQALETYLGSLFWIDQVQLMKITAQHTVYRLLTSVQSTDLPRRFSEDQRLALPDSPLPATAETLSPQHNYLTYRWVPL
jgi:hypothetical protein